MVRSIVFLVTCFFAFSSVNAQEMKNGELSYTKVIECQGKDKEQLFSKSREFLAYFYKNSLYTVKLDDKESGKLITKGTFQDFYINKVKWQTVSYVYSFTMEHTMTIRCKDGKLQINIACYDIIPVCNKYEWKKCLLSEIYPELTYKGNLPKKQVMKGFDGVYDAACEKMRKTVLALEAYINSIEEDF